MTDEEIDRRPVQMARRDIAYAQEAMEARARSANEQHRMRSAIMNRGLQDGMAAMAKFGITAQEFTRAMQTLGTASARFAEAMRQLADQWARDAVLAQTARNRASHARRIPATSARRRNKHGRVGVKR